jgi:hypothetical protein
VIQNKNIISLSSYLLRLLPFSLGSSSSSIHYVSAVHIFVVVDFSLGMLKPDISGLRPELSVPYCNILNVTEPPHFQATQRDCNSFISLIKASFGFFNICVQFGFGFECLVLEMK